MDATTVQTPRQPHQEQIRLLKVVTTRIADAGIEAATINPETEIPENWTDLRYRVRMHQDGSICTADCNCIPCEDRIHIRLGETLWKDEWTWYGGRHGLSGWRRIGPSLTEKRLQERVEILEEDLDHEAGWLHLTEEDLAALTGRAERLRASLRRIRKDYRDLDRLASGLLRVAVTGWGAALILAVALVWAVIA